MLQITPNPRPAGNLSITANSRARMSSVVSIDWDNVTGKPALVTGLGGVASTGIFVVTDLLGGAAVRAITGTANQITVTDGDGVAGNPIISTPSALTFTGKTVTGGTFSGITITTSTFNGNTWTAGTGVLTIAALKTLTANATITLAGTDGKSLTLTTALTVSGNDGTLAFGAASKTLSVNNSLTLAGTDATTMTFPTTSATLARTDTGQTFTGTNAFGILTATTYNKVTITAPASAATLTLIDGTTLTGPASSGTVMTLGNTETVTGVKTYGSAGAVGRFKLAGTTSGSTTLDASATASGTLTLPAATDTLMGKATTDILTNKTLNSAGTGNVLQVSSVTVSAGQYPGETTTGSATAGNVGEYIQATLGFASRITLANSVSANIASISLTAGDWEVSATGYIEATGSPANNSGNQISISQTTNTLDQTEGLYIYMAPLAAAASIANGVGPARKSLSGTTTIYAVMSAAFTAGTFKAYGQIKARRVR